VTLKNKQLYGRQAVERKLPFGEDLNTEAEEYPLLEVVTRKLLIKSLRAGKNVVGFFKVWKSR
jgi:hypothetical protein